MRESLRACLLSLRSWRSAKVQSCKLGRGDDDKESGGNKEREKKDNGSPESIEAPTEMRTYQESRSVT